ncbi:MAG: hypothetical protein KKB51_24710 [Candidatus Riflebacteria bacterium]|nr:hypothetical protein [Candidatus Riflebacteria bacterium]
MKLRSRWSVFYQVMILLSSLGMCFGAGGMGKNQGFRDNPAVKEFMAAQAKKGEEFNALEAKEGKEFMATLIGKSKEEKIAAIRTFKTTQYENNCDFREKMLAERDAFMADLQSKSGSNSAGANPQRAMMESRKAQMNTKITNFFAQKHAENMAYLDEVLKDPSIDGTSLDKALSSFFQKQKADAGKFMNELRSQRGPGF